MAEFKDDAYALEKTINKAEIKESKPKPKTATTKASKVTKFKVDDLILEFLNKQGLKLTAVNVQTLSPQEVIIWNPGVPHPKVQSNE